MKINFTITTLLCSMLLIAFSSTAQPNFWQETESTQLRNKQVTRTKNVPKTFQLFDLQLDDFKNYLNRAPLRFSPEAEQRTLIATIPMPDGTFEQFEMLSSPVLSPELSAKYPDIQSYTGIGIDDPTAYLKISVSNGKGISGMIRSAEHSTVYFDPYTGDLQTYIFYYRKDRDAEGTKMFKCSTIEEAVVSGRPSSSRNTDDQILRDYRLVVSTTGEYTQWHGGTVALALAAINTTMTRVNGVYETDFAITMTLIGNTDDVIYTDPGNDPYTSNLSSQLESTLTSVIGVANYDIGHLFHQEPNSNGFAGCIGCVCSTDGSKGSAFTSHVTPENDPFDIDFVAHEIGHQFGANHTWTFNGSEGTGVQAEPGSGSTIMGYAGITGPTYDVQSNSDDYFHYYNINQVSNYIQSQSCHAGNTNTVNPLSNAVPVANAGSDHTIPEMTAFVLKGQGSDADGDPLTFCWEQTDVNTSVPLPDKDNPSGTTNWRSRPPSSSPDRYMPQLSDIIAGNLVNTWETVSDVCRTLNFALVVRDNAAGGGQTHSDLMQVTVDCNTGPFVVNAPNGGEIWDVSTTETVTWDVAGTDAGNVNCANVDILLSTDGGNTYPITLAAGVPNDGSHPITVPNNLTTTARVMVFCSDNIFFDISNADFSIETNAPKANLSTAASLSSAEGTDCNTRSITFDVEMSKQPSADTDVTWSFSGTAIDPDDYTVMGGTSHTFTTANWNTPKTVTLLIEQDAVIEPDETIIVDISTVTGSDAIIGSNNQLTFTLENDDNVPIFSQIVTIWSDDFEDLTTTGPLWNYIEVGGIDENVFIFSSQFESSCNRIGFSTVAAGIANFDSGAGTFSCGYTRDVSDVYIYREVDATNLKNITVTFDYMCDGIPGEDEGYLEWSTDASTWNTLATYVDVTSLTNVTENLPASVNNTVFYIGWRWINDNRNPNQPPPLTFDNVVVEGTYEVPVQTAVNSGSGFAEQDLGPNQTVHFYDQNTGNIMATIIEKSGHDYGCTQLYIENEGTSYFISSAGPELFDKTIRVIPSNPNASGEYDVMVYYTATEVTGWDAGSYDMADIQMYKAPGDLIAATSGVEMSTSPTISAYGTDWKVTGTFNTGFSGIGAGGGAVTSLPIEWLDFTAKAKGETVHLNWATIAELNNKGFEAQHSIDGKNWEAIAWVDSRGNSIEKQDYQLMHSSPKAGINYYRLQQVDTNGESKLSEIRTVHFAAQSDVVLYPHPFSEQLTIKLVEASQKASIYITDMAGKLVFEGTIVGNTDLNLKHLMSGVYHCTIVQNDKVYQKRIMKI